MTGRTMLVLVGGRSATPAIIGALQFLDKIGRIKFLLCEHKDNLYSSLQKNTMRILRGQKECLICEEDKDIETVDGNDSIEVYKSVEKLLRKTSDLSFVNLTSAPQEMAFAVYNYVRNNYPNAFIFNANTQTSRITSLVSKESPYPLTKKLTVEDYVTACELKIFERKFDINKLCFTKSQAEEVINSIVNNIPSANEILHKLRGANQSIKIPITMSVKIKDIPKNISTDEFSNFLSLLKKNEIISKFEKKHQEFSYRFEEKSAHAFLYGDWLEYYVYLEGKKIGFDSIELSVELSDYKGEIDVFFIHNANPLICECKTGKYETADLAKLESKAVKLGGNFCVKLFITSSQTIDEKFLNRAKARKIVIVSGNELRNISRILQKEMNNPTYSRH